jgi:hypothetical protein
LKNILNTDALDMSVRYGIVCSMKRAIAFGLALSLASCAQETASTAKPPPLKAPQMQEQFTAAVDYSVAHEGQEVELPVSVSCDSDLLLGRLSVQRILADEQGYAAFTVQDRDGDVPAFGLVQCFDRVTDDGVQRIIRSADGY